MPLNSREQFSVFIVLAPMAFAQGISSAEPLAPFKISPLLLGAGVAPKAVAAPVAPKLPEIVSVKPAIAETIAEAPAAPMSAAKSAPVVPPQVEERQAPAPLYSAYVEAGLIADAPLQTAQKIVGHTERPDEYLPSFVSADRISGATDVEMVAEGNVVVRKRNSILRSDRLTQWAATNEMEAEGNVSLVRDGDHIRGPKMRLNSSNETGFFETPEYSIQRGKVGTEAVVWTGDEVIDKSSLSRGQGHASRMSFEGAGKYRLSDATYSTCTPEAGQDPDWFARTSNLRLDYEDQTGTATNATMIFKGVPIFYTPWLSFALNNQRKSGLLPPTIGSSTRGGQEFSQPVYWAIAPNLDATLTPRVMSKRGTLWNGEFRYLEPSFSGAIERQHISNDRLVNATRSAYSITHRHDLGAGFVGTLDIKDVSDNTFFSDMSNSTTVVAQTNLIRQGTISYSGSWWSANLLAQNYKTLQDPSLPLVAAPYSRRPQLTLKARRGDLPLGLDFAFDGESVNFRHPTQIQARRLTAYPQLALPLQTQAFYVTPKIGMHMTRYALERQAIGTADKLSRSVPIISVDTGVTFEREASLFGSSLTQTLEPRLFYVKIPARDQSQIPVFDSGIADFNFTQIFSENRYSGGDRIGDTDQLTAMVTSRLLDPGDGSELMRGALGQLVYFGGQNVTLPGEIPRKNLQTDYLGTFSGRVLPKTFVDAGVQYSPRFRRAERLNLSARYQPESGKVLNAGYRYTREVLGQVDVSGQWPLFGGWNTVGRVNFSTKEGRMVESIAGLEYNAGCWAARVVVQRIATQAQKVNSAIFFQLELGDFASLGSSPIDLLKRNVPGYGVINQ